MIGNKRAKLGKTYRDSITGFEGTCIAITDWLQGCRRVTLQPKKMQESGKPVEDCTFDEGRLEGVSDGGNPGGPAYTPARAADPR